jgi:hypothetical protein
MNGQERMGRTIFRHKSLRDYRCILPGILKNHLTGIVAGSPFVDPGGDHRKTKYSRQIATIRRNMPTRATGSV